MPTATPTPADWAAFKRLYDANGPDRIVDMLLANIENDHSAPEWLEDDVLGLAKKIDEKYGHHAR